jgi:hypothetical protein
MSQHNMAAVFSMVLAAPCSFGCGTDQGSASSGADHCQTSHQQDGLALGYAGLAMGYAFSR